MPIAASRLSRALDDAELDAFGAELDALRERLLAARGEADLRYIRRVESAVRISGVLGRLLLWGGAPFAVALWPVWLLGVGLLALSKILENMELGHNVIHGQYDFTGDPRLQGATYEWDIAGTAESWRHTHNHKHHTWTNVRGMDDDIGYGLLRIFPEQRWKPFALGQPLYALVLALYFQWGVAIQHLEIGKCFSGRKTWRELYLEAKPLLCKLRWQLGKDYLLFPLLAGPFFLPVLLGNLAANGLRNLWTYVVIFCGHFTTEVETFTKASTVNESRGHWYARQMRGSSNISGGKLMHLMTGNLSHQIEHHLFPDIPAWRYGAIAPEVRAIAARYGQHYTVGSLPKQFGQVVWRILRHALPSRPPKRVDADGDTAGGLPAGA
jgi:linoleoyl-CoA desaturase